MDELAKHDKRAAQIEVCLEVHGKALEQISAAQASTAISHQKTQENLEEASKALKQAAETVAENSKWQTWAQSQISTSQKFLSSQYAKVMIVILGIVAAAFGLKAGGFI
jgi:hypothetical protein